MLIGVRSNLTSTLLVGSAVVSATPAPCPPSAGVTPIVVVSDVPTDLSNYQSCTLLRKELELLKKDLELTSKKKFFGLTGTIIS